MLWFTCACTVPALLISWSATYFIRRWAPTWGLVDQPAARKVHTTPTPLGGGLAIYAGLVIPLLVAHVLAWCLVQSGYSPGWIPAPVRELLPGVLHRSGQLWGVIAAGTV